MILQFGGGKDSLATLYLYREQKEDVTVYFGNTGAIYPHMVKFVYDTCEKLGFKLKVIRPPFSVVEFTEHTGLPADIVPVEISPEKYLLTEKPKQPIQSHMRCCYAMLWKPMHEAVLASGEKVVIRGTKKTDQYVTVPDGYEENGITYLSPLWDWTDQDVFDYLKEQGAELPDHYKEVNTSFDCWICTGHLASHDADGRLKYTKKHYPELWPIVVDRSKRLKAAVDEQKQLIDSVLSITEE